MKRRFKAPSVHGQPAQLALMLPAGPKDLPLRSAFRRAELARVGLDFKAVHSHPRGAALLRTLADAYRRSDEGDIRQAAGTLIRMRSAFR